MDITGIWEGILIGSAGGAAAGLVLAVVQQGSRWVVEKIHSRRVYGWLCANTTDEPGSRFRSTRAIASWNNLTMDRVRYLCSINRKIYLSTGPSDTELWGLWDHGERSVYEERGLLTLGSAEDD